MSLHELFAARNALHAAQHRERNEGIDCNVLWITHSHLRRLGVTTNQAKHAQRTGALKCRRPGVGHLPALFHPEDVATYLVQRAKPPALATLTALVGAEKAKELNPIAEKLAISIATSVIKRMNKCSNP